MSRADTNNRKREEMAFAVRRALDGGWTTAQLAALLRVTSGTIGTWKRGASMGTNAQRATLADLKSPAEERPRLLDVAKQLRREADISDERATRAREAQAFQVEANHVRRAVRLLARAVFLESIGQIEREVADGR